MGREGPRSYCTHPVALWAGSLTKAVDGVEEGAGDSRFSCFQSQPQGPVAEDLGVSLPSLAVQHLPSMEEEEEGDGEEKKTCYLLLWHGPCPKIC